MSKTKIEQFSPEAKLSRGRVGVVLSFLCLGCLLQGSTYSHVTSFFNSYAIEQKGLSSTKYGIIMGSYCLVFVFVTPMTAKVVAWKKFKDKNIMFVGWTVDALFCIFGSATCFLSPGSEFFLGVLTLRILGAAGCAVGFFMLYIITALEMNEIKHIVIPLLETIYGLAAVIGPAMSGVLYDYGGYSLPFLVIGGALLTLMITALVIFPHSKAATEEELTKPTTGLRQAWKFPVVIQVLSALSAFIVISFNESTLARQLYLKFDMSASQSGFMFLSAGVMYGFSSLLFGFLSQKVSDARYLVLFSAVVAVAGLTLQGPLVPILQTKQTVIIAQMLLGFGLGPAFVCSYLHSLKYISNGNETKETYAALSAIYTPATSIGCTIGPLLSGFILDYFSYRLGILINAVLLVFMIVLMSVSICLTKAHGKTKPQREETPQSATVAS